MTRLTDTLKNMLRNGDFSLQPPFTAATNVASRWINGQAAGGDALMGRGWAIPSGAVASSADAKYINDATLGIGRMQLTTNDATGAITVASSKVVEAQYLIPVSGNTSYTVEFYIETNNVATNAAFLDIVQINATLGTITTTSSTKLSGTNARQKITLTFTSQASARFFRVFLRNNVAGNIGWAKFDSIVIRPTTQPARTAV